MFKSERAHVLEFLNRTLLAPLCAQSVQIELCSH